MDRRWITARTLAFAAAAIAIGCLAAVIAANRYALWSAHGLVGEDFLVFVAWGQRVLDTGSLYTAAQLAGPYVAEPPTYFDRANLPALYPPQMGLVFVALRLVPLPVAALLWWGVPIALLAYAAYRMPPRPWAWPLLALVGCLPATSVAFIVGNATMWVAALVAAGRLWGWPAALVLLKPTFAPLALVGIRRRSWWAAAGLLGLAGLALWPELGRYLTALHNSDVTWAYSLSSLPLVLAPFLLAKQRQEHAVDAHVTSAAMTVPPPPSP